ncbi:hypothetical protein OC834_007404 [Tilletia horrida]|nr:hypothetical protein OC834_007404 [Tilletia horrida]
MTRGRRPNLDLPVTPSLNAQRAFRERKRKHLSDLEENVQRLSKENDELKNRLAAAGLAPPSTAPPPTTTTTSSSSSSSSSSPPATTTTTTTTRGSRNTTDASTQTVASPIPPCDNCIKWADAYSAVSNELSALRAQLSGLANGAQPQPQSQSQLAPSPTAHSRMGSIDSSQPARQSTMPPQHLSGLSASYAHPPLPTTSVASSLASFSLSPKRAAFQPSNMAIPPHKRQRTSMSAASSASSPYSITTPMAAAPAAPTTLPVTPVSSAIAQPPSTVSTYYSNRHGSSATHSTTDDSIVPSPTFTATGADEVSTVASSSTSLCCVEEAALAKGDSPENAARQGCGGTLRKLCDMVTEQASEHKVQAEHTRASMHSSSRSSASVASAATSPTNSGLMPSYVNPATRRWSSEHDQATSTSSNNHLGSHHGTTSASTSSSPWHGSRQLSMPSSASYPYLSTATSNTSKLNVNNTLQRLQAQGLGSSNYGLVQSQMTIPPASIAASEIGAANAITAMSRALAADVDPQRPGGLAGILTSHASQALASIGGGSSAVAGGAGQRLSIDANSRLGELGGSATSFWIPPPAEAQAQAQAQAQAGPFFNHTIQPAAPPAQAYTQIQPQSQSQSQQSGGSKCCKPNSTGSSSVSGSQTSASAGGEGCKPKSKESCGTGGGCGPKMPSVVGGAKADHVAPLPALLSATGGPSASSAATATKDGAHHPSTSQAARGGNGNSAEPGSMSIEAVLDLKSDECCFGLMNCG